MIQGLPSDLMPETKNPAHYSTCRQHHLDRCGERFPEGKSDALNCTRNCSQLSTSSTMSQNFTPTFVYQRRRQHKNTVSFFTIHAFTETKPSNGCHSAISSDTPSVAAQDHMISIPERATEAVKSSIVRPVECSTVAKASFNGCPVGKEAASEEPLVTNLDGVLNVCSTNDNCSSSKSNLELSSASLKIDMDDAAECSSSGAMIAEKVSEEISERDICISILKSQGILDRVLTRQNRASKQNTGGRSDKYCSKSCKVCRRLESTSNMLVCDSCEDAFHMSCCNRHIIPVGEWLCSSCLKKKHKILKEKSTCNSINSNTEIGRNLCSESEGELGSLEFMFRENEPYMSNVRIGDEFQADVPEWCGPVDEHASYLVFGNSTCKSTLSWNVYHDCDLTGDPLEIDSSNNSNMQEWDSTKPLNLSSIGNWLQCREVIEGGGEGVDETVCGKWRRAPLFEVQTDEFECFHCILWDPAHADCAVPQELETEEVMKQLKYIEMLRPRLAAKRRKLDSSKSSGSQEQSRS
ncbi:hypothetical protein BUALT_Bualt11G0081000 [Buddleja alternifolia]|uniref:Uncharacterized protein n=1 Tax=Buddleja alternifolia TaxID=168488 RepID=A0AAV6X0N4_9LAMI|nr:hypothetical protein BUALT_Bualt11G0081000 [Buddleja alternifolia]